MFQYNLPSRNCTSHCRTLEPSSITPHKNLVRDPTGPFVQVGNESLPNTPILSAIREQMFSVARFPARKFIGNIHLLTLLQLCL
jgi:hypothetical protein